MMIAIGCASPVWRVERARVRRPRAAMLLPSYTLTVTPPPSASLPYTRTYQSFSRAASGRYMSPWRACCCTTSSMRTNACASSLVGT